MISIMMMTIIMLTVMTLLLLQLMLLLDRAEIKKANGAKSLVKRELCPSVQNVPRY